MLTKQDTDLDVEGQDPRRKKKTLPQQTIIDMSLLDSIMRVMHSGEQNMGNSSARDAELVPKWTEDQEEDFWKNRSEVSVSEGDMALWIQENGYPQYGPVWDVETAPWIQENGYPQYGLLWEAETAPWIKENGYPHYGPVWDEEMVTWIQTDEMETRKQEYGFPQYGPVWAEEMAPSTQEFEQLDSQENENELLGEKRLNSLLREENDLLMGDNESLQKENELFKKTLENGLYGQGSSKEEDVEEPLEEFMTVEKDENLLPYHPDFNGLANGSSSTIFAVLALFCF